MDMLNRCVLGVAAGLAIGLGSMTAEAAPITYQGVLEDGGSPADGMYEMQFVLGDSAVFGIGLQFLPPMDVEVVDGVFEVELDFDDVHFDGSDRWLDVRVEGEFLSPRTKINYAPYAIRASHADHADVASDLEVPWVVVSDLDIVDATSIRGVPLRGYMSNSFLTNPAVLGETDSVEVGGAGVLGRANSGSDSSSAAGVRGETNSTGFSGFGVHGIHHGNGFAVYGENMGVGSGVVGTTDGGIGVLGTTPNGTGVFGTSTNGFGVRASSSSDSGIRTTTNTGGAAIEGAHGTSGTEFLGASDDYGLAGFNTDDDGEGTAIYGEGGRIGVRGVALPDGFGADLTRIGVQGFAGGFITGANMIYGVSGFGQAPADGGARTSYGVYGGAQVGNSSNTAYGLFGETFGPGGVQYAGYFQGDVHVAGTLSKSSGSFKIDHPMDPENKYLSHSFVESPEMMNVYSGVVTLDDEGNGVVELPEYFDSLNTDYRYQLTAIGAAMPSLHVAELIEGNSFAIGGGAAHKQVSWEVTGIRKDASALYHPIVVEEDKAPQHRGLFLDPAAFGFGNDRAIHQSGHEQN
jgi:hypothetical protein